MLDSVYILVPSTVSTKTVLDSEVAYEELDVEGLDKCTLWHMDNRDHLNSLEWFDERNVIFSVRSRTTFWNCKGAIDKCAIQAAQDAMRLKVKFRPPALL